MCFDYVLPCFCFAFDLIYFNKAFCTPKSSVMPIKSNTPIFNLKSDLPYDVSASYEG